MCHTFLFFIIGFRYDGQPLFGPSLDKNKPSTARPKQVFFEQKSVNLFLASYAKQDSEATTLLATVHNNAFGVDVLLSSGMFESFLFLILACIASLFFSRMTS